MENIYIWRENKCRKSEKEGKEEKRQRKKKRLYVRDNARRDILED